ncbi:MAG: hypothetical protein ACOY6N_10500 [Pseudomonadota bacterium]
MRNNVSLGSAAEKQRRWRERAFKDPDGLLLTRLQVAIEPSAAEALERYCERYSVTKREAVERALRALDNV